MAICARHWAAIKAQVSGVWRALAFSRARFWEGFARVVLGASMRAINRRIQQKRDVVHRVAQQFFDLSADGRHFARNTTHRGGGWNYRE
jgi:hypothetical protein